jgi:hypothetical protein
MWCTPSKMASATALTNPRTQITTASTAGSIPARRQRWWSMSNWPRLRVHEPVKPVNREMVDGPRTGEDPRRHRLPLQFLSALGRHLSLSLSVLVFLLVAWASCSWGVRGKMHYGKRREKRNADWLPLKSSNPTRSLLTVDISNRKRRGVLPVAWFRAPSIWTTSMLGSSHLVT